MCVFPVFSHCWVGVGLDDLVVPLLDFIPSKRQARNLFHRDTAGGEHVWPQVQLGMLICMCCAAVSFRKCIWDGSVDLNYTVISQKSNAFCSLPTVFRSLPGPQEGCCVVNG